MKKAHSRTWLSNVHSETQKLRRQNANGLRSRACIAFFPTWSLNFQIADTCTHCVPIFISAPKEKRLNFLGCLVRQHGGRRAYTLRENEKHKARSKTFQVLHNPFNQGDSCHNPWQVRFWSKAYYGRKRNKNEASILTTTEDARLVKSYRSWIHTSHLPFLASHKKK